MVARLDPPEVGRLLQPMHYFVANAPWEEVALLRAARARVLPALQRHGPVAAWIVDDTGLPKNGQRSVGVARLYRGALGKQGNCHGAVVVKRMNEGATLPHAVARGEPGPYVYATVILAGTLLQPLSSTRF